jgi:hypothetical protein
MGDPAAPSTRRYLLAGLLICGACGRRMESAWSHGKPAYRCRHGRTTAAPPSGDRPGNAYVREDRIPPPRGRAALGQRRGRDRVPARARDHPHLRSGSGNPAGRRRRKDHHDEGKLNPQRPHTGRRRNKERRSPCAGGSPRPGDNPACPETGGRGVLTCPRLEPENAGNFPNSRKFPWLELSGRCPQVRHFAFRPASRAGRRAMSGAGRSGGAWTQSGGHGLCCPQSPGRRNIRRYVPLPAQSPK